MKRIGLVLGFFLLAYFVRGFLQFRDDHVGRESVYELLDATQPYKAEVAKALRSAAAMPVPLKLPAHARAMSARPDGTIVVEVSDELAPGGRITFIPERLPKGEYLWTCRTAGLRDMLVPASCRP